MRASVSKPLASVAYGRSVARATREPTAIRSVADATAPINANISSAGRRSTGAVAPEQVVVGEHAVEPRGFSRGRHRQCRTDVVAERRQRDPHLDRHASSRASTAAPMTPA